LANLTAYTLAGGLSSALVGMIIGWLGDLLLSEGVSRYGIFPAIVVAGVAIARETGWIAIPLPQVRRQTKDFWAKVFPDTVAAALWGFDLGMVFTTWLTFSGIWILFVVVTLIGEPVFGAVLFVWYWLGRALSVWIAPLLMENANATPELMDGISEHYMLFQRIHVLGLVWSVLVLFLWFAYGIPL